MEDDVIGPNNEEEYGIKKIADSNIEDIGVEPHKNKEISIEFFDNKRVNILANLDTEGKIIENSGKVIIKDGSLSNVTRAAGEVIIKLYERLNKEIDPKNPNINPKINRKLIETIKKNSDILASDPDYFINLIKKGREDVSKVYKDIYEKFINPLLSLGDLYNKSGLAITLEQIRSLFIGPSAVKAMLDSAPLGEAVLKAMNNKLLPCFDDLLVTEDDINDFFKIMEDVTKMKEEEEEEDEKKEGEGEEKMEEEKGEEEGEVEGEVEEGEGEVEDKMEIEVPVKKNITRTDIIEFIRTWLLINYCRVFQLVSSDILGAINGLLTIRSIIDYTPFTGFISIPKGQGGQIGLDNKVCIYALILQNVFDPSVISNFFLLPREQYAVFQQNITSLREKFKKLNLLNLLGNIDNFSIIRVSVRKLMSLLDNEDEGMNGVLQGEIESKTARFVEAYNVYKAIILIEEYFTKHAMDISNYIAIIKGSYKNQLEILNNEEWITWLCFQLTRYQQIKKIFEKPRTDASDTEDEEELGADPGADPGAESGEEARAESGAEEEKKNAEILNLYEQDKKKVCDYIEAKKDRFEKEWHNILSKLLINEGAFGHDFKSEEIAKTMRELFKEDELIRFLKDKGDEKKLKKGARYDYDDDDDGDDEFDFDSHSENRDMKVIEHILIETNCIVFLEGIYRGGNKNLWTVGTDASSIIYKRFVKSFSLENSDVMSDESKESDQKPDKKPKAGKSGFTMPVCSPTIEFLNITIGPWNGNNTTCVMFDFSKYLINPIMRERSEGDLDTLLKKNLLDESQMALSFLSDDNLQKIAIGLSNKCTTVATILSGVDAASIKLPNSTIFVTGELTIPIDVGQGVTMKIIFKAGYNDEFTPGLFKRTWVNNIKKFDDSKNKDLAICFDYFFRKGINQDIKKELESKQVAKITKKQAQDKKITSSYFTFNFSNSTPLKSLVIKDYKVYLTMLFNKLIAEPDNYSQNYRIFLDILIRNTSGFTDYLEKRSMFDTEEINRKWERLIFFIAQDGGLNIVIAFIETMRKIEGTKLNVSLLEKTKKDIFDPQLTFIRETALKLKKQESSPLILIAAEIKASLSQRKICMLENKEPGNTFIRAVTVDEILNYLSKHFPGILSSYSIKPLDLLAIISETDRLRTKRINEEFLTKSASHYLSTGLTLVVERKRKSTPDLDTLLYEKNKITAYLEELLVQIFDDVDGSGFQTIHKEMYNLNHDLLKKNQEEIDIYLREHPERKLTAVESKRVAGYDNGESQGFEGESQGFEGDSQGVEGYSQGFEGDSQGFEGDSQGFEGDSQGFEGDSQESEEDSSDDFSGGGSSDELLKLHEDIKHINDRLNQLKQEEETIIRNMITFTNEPITDIESEKTALVISPTLFNNLIAEQQQYEIDKSNKVLSENSEDIQLNIEIPNELFESYTNMKDLNDKLVIVNRVGDKYHIESADKFFQSFLDNYKGSTDIEPMKNATTIASETVEKGVTNVQQTLTYVKDTIGKGYEDIVEKTEEIKEKLLGNPSAPTSSAPTSSAPTSSAPTSHAPTSDVKENDDEGYGDMIYTLKENILGKPEKLASTTRSDPIAAAAAAGGSKKSLKKQRKYGKKLTKRKKNKSKKSNNFTKRKRGGKKPKKTKRRN